MNQESRQCQNCKNQFVIEPEDFGFYEKIKVPPPTFCPECRNQRRMSWRNERSLYKRKCNVPGHSEEVISMYRPDAPYVVYDRDYWWSDAWDPLASGKEYDFTKPFFTQFDELLRTVPMIALANQNSVNSDYVNYSDGNKNCYLIFGGGWNENVRYSNKMMEDKDSQDLLVVSKSQLCYECVGCTDSYRLLYSLNSKNCRDSYFLYSCRNCSDCFGCANLVNKKYCFFNEQLTKEEYGRRVLEMNMHSRAGREQVEKMFYETIYLKAIHRYANIVNAVQSTGDNINNAKNCKVCFDIFHDVENVKYAFSALVLKDFYDGNGIFKNEFSYELVDANVGNSNLASITIYDSSSVRYSVNCHGSSDLFGCIGLRSKQYCILNHQYSKEEYEALMPRIVQHMNEMPYADKKERVYRYGEFFPTELSPHAYNETIAQEYFPISETGAHEQGFEWRREFKKDYGITVKASDLPDMIEKVPDSITRGIVGCAHNGACPDQCTTAFKITLDELGFYKSLGIPLPILCPNCRHYQRMKKRKPLKLWHRQCMCDYEKYPNTVKHVHHKEGECPNEFETSYAPGRKEIVYCESCYQSEVL